jgi:hypothetical protein
VADYAEVIYVCRPMVSGGAAYTLADYNEKELQCMIGTITPKEGGNDRADWCQMAYKVKVIAYYIF